MTHPHPAFLVIADISGYTGFSKAHADHPHHAQYVVSELMAAMLAVAEPALKAAKLEGDAIFFEAKDDGELNRPAVRQALPALFDAFYARRATLAAANSCSCPGCKQIGALHLKAVIHHGAITRYSVGKFDEIAGFDIIVAHRLLKNGIGRQRYMLITESAWNFLDWATAAAPHLERYDDIGEVKGWLITDGLGGCEPEATPEQTSATLRLREVVRKAVVGRLRKWGFLTPGMCIARLRG